MLIELALLAWTYRRVRFALTPSISVMTLLHWIVTVCSLSVTRVAQRLSVRDRHVLPLLYGTAVARRLRLPRVLRMIAVALSARRLRVTRIRCFPPLFRRTPSACRLRWPDVWLMAPMFVRFLGARRLRVWSLPTLTRKLLSTCVL